MHPLELEPALKHILIVDDNFHLRQILRVALQHHGYAVSEAESGAAAIKAASIGKPDLIVLDLSLPDMDAGGTGIKAEPEDSAYSHRRLQCVFWTSMEREISTGRDDRISAKTSRVRGH